MKKDRYIPKTRVHDKLLKNYSEVDSLNRLSGKDAETMSLITAGGDRSFLDRDIDDADKPKDS